MFENKPEARGGYPASYETETKKLTRHCEVTAILVLYGLPRWKQYLPTLHTYEGFARLLLLLVAEVFRIEFFEMQAIS